MKRAQRDHPQLSILVREYGFSLYEKQRPQADLRDLLLGIQDLHGYARPALVAPWKVVRTWERLEPGEIRTPMPVLVLRALKAVALGWRWYRVALLLHIAYFGLLRPGEVCALSRSDILLRESARGVEMLIRMERVKSWSRGARSQYAKVDALQCCEFCNRFVKSMSPGMRL